MRADLPGQNGFGQRPPGPLPRDPLSPDPLWPGRRSPDSLSRDPLSPGPLSPGPLSRDSLSHDPLFPDPVAQQHGTDADRVAGLSSAGMRGAGRDGAQHISPIRVIRRPWAAAAAVLGIVVICLGAAGFVWASHTGRSATPVGRGPITPIPAGHWAAVPPAKAEVVPRPTGLVIPAIGVRTKLIRLGLTASGALQVPASISVAGWYTGSPRPGGTGSAVIAGHIDSVSGPGVFFRLRELRPGDLVYVQRGHAKMAVFKVTGVRRFLKTKFPTAAVYGPVPSAQLRLITCGGTFDPATGHYLSNVVVFAVLQ
jgi:Sortase domain